MIYLESSIIQTDKRFQKTTLDISDPSGRSWRLVWQSPSPSQSRALVSWVERPSPYQSSSDDVWTISVDMIENRRIAHSLFRRTWEPGQKTIEERRAFHSHVDKNDRCSICNRRYGGISLYCPLSYYFFGFLPIIIRVNHWRLRFASWGSKKSKLRSYPPCWGIRRAGNRAQCLSGESSKYTSYKATAKRVGVYPPRESDRDSACAREPHRQPKHSPIRSGKVPTKRLLIASAVVFTDSPHCPVRADSLLHWSSASPLFNWFPPPSYHRVGFLKFSPHLARWSPSLLLRFWG